MKYRPERANTSAASSSLKILETVARLGVGTTAKDVTDALEMPPATAYRLLNALVADEYLVRTSDLRGFALGQALSGLITAATPPTVPSAARTAIDQFRTGTRFAVHLIMFRSSTLRIADEDPDHPLQSTTELLRNLHGSAAGKLMLAQMEDVSDVLPVGRPLHGLTSSTITDPADLTAQLAEIREAGVAFEINELEDGLATVAVAVALPNRPAQAALCLSGPSERVPAIKEHVEQVRQFAARLAPLLF